MIRRWNRKEKQDVLDMEEAGLASRERPLALRGRTLLSLHLLLSAPRSITISTKIAGPFVSIHANRSSAVVGL